MYDYLFIYYATCLPLPRLTCPPPRPPSSGWWTSWASSRARWVAGRLWRLRLCELLTGGLLNIASVQVESPVCKWWSNSKWASSRASQLIMADYGNGDVVCAIGLDYYYNANSASQAYARMRGICTPRLQGQRPTDFAADLY